MARLRRGYARVRAARANAFPFARGPFPAPVLWRIVLLAMRTADPSWRRRFTAVVEAFLVARRSPSPHTHTIWDWGAVSTPPCAVPIGQVGGGGGGLARLGHSLAAAFAAGGHPRGGGSGGGGAPPADDDADEARPDGDAPLDGDDGGGNCGDGSGRGGSGGGGLAAAAASSGVLPFGAVQATLL